jgi:serine/threonine protein kinase
VSHLQPGTLFVGRYEVVRFISGGGMGAVYEVVDQNTRRKRALKVMRPEVVADEQMRRRFRREATVTASIESEHIAEVLDAGVDETSGAPYIVLELLKGQELGHLLAQRGALPPAEVTLYLSQVAMALEKAHAADVVHRDLKPGNLFVTYRDDGTPRIKLLDFGIAKILSGTLTGPATQGILGTPLYMANEQILEDMEISALTDLYALGHIAFTMLTGEPYWKPEQEAVKTPYQLLVKVMKGARESARERAFRRAGVHLPPAFDVWFAKATASSPADRFTSAFDMIEELKEVLEGAAVALSEPPATVDMSGSANRAHSDATLLSPTEPSDES